MENQQIEQLHQLSREEKFEIIQLHWNDLTVNPDNLPIPEGIRSFFVKELNELKAV